MNKKLIGAILGFVVIGFIVVGFSVSIVPDGHVLSATHTQEKVKGIEEKLAEHNSVFGNLTAIKVSGEKQFKTELISLTLKQGGISEYTSNVTVWGSFNVEDEKRIPFLVHELHNVIDKYAKKE